jgi:hypothetical protein
MIDDWTELKHTHRGFRFYEFTDRNGERCSFQKSSVATEDCCWLGIDDIKPRRLVSGEGWQDVDLPDGTQLSGRMHLTREGAAILSKQLHYFAETGELPASPLSPLPTSEVKG